MRPWTPGEPCTPKLAGIKTSFLVQPKLNGARAVMVVRNGSVLDVNRHGGEYGFQVHNRDDFLRLPDETILDGIVFKGLFYPFEAIVVGGVSLADSCVTVRAGEAKRIALTLGHEWLFDEPLPQFYATGKDNLPMWEGVVAKVKGQPYQPVKKAHWVSTGWMRFKW